MSYVIYLVLLFVILIALGIYFLLRYQRERQRKLADRIFYIKTFGKQLRVPLDSCEIAHKVFYDERDGKKIAVDVCLVTYATELPGGEKRLFKSVPLSATPDQLKELMKKHKRGTLYYNKDNPEQHYLELPFGKELAYGSNG